MARGLAIRFDAGWAKYKRAITPGTYSPFLKQRVGLATAKNALEARRAIRKEITRGVPPTNAALTIELKGGRGRPIVGTPGLNLFNSITHDQEDWDRATIGVNRMTTREGRTFNVAEIVHEGATVKVSQRMRLMFGMLAWASMAYRQGKPIPHLEGRAKVLWEMSKRKRFRLLSPSTTHIVIPPRPFIRYAFQDRQLKEKVRRNWERAVQQAFRDIKRTGG